MQATGRMPVAGLQALLRNSLDYAGLFPPASLQLEPAIKNYAKHRFGPDAWFLSRFVCPVNRLSELDPYVRLFAKSAPLLVSALALPSPTWRQAVPKLEESLALAFRFQHSHPDPVLVDSIEIPLPADLTDLVGVVETRDLVSALIETVGLGGLPEITPFLEITAPDWGHQVGATIEAIARKNQSSSPPHCQPAAFKLRTGGVKAEAFPSIERVALVIDYCRATGLRFKCTAGLHHPIRHHEQSVGTKMHGFLNILGTAVLVHAGSLSREDLPLGLEDEEPSHFLFDAKGFAWNGVHATVEQIREARRNLIVSFGSCSFEEPLEDLRKLGML